MERGGKRGVLVWHRRAGKDAVGINFCAVSCFQRVGLYWHMLPTYDQGRKIVWEGMTRDGRKFLSAFPGFDRPGAPDSIVKRKRDDKMFLELVNGSVYQVVGTDDIDKLVGANPVGVILSEYSLHDPAAYNYLRPILAENGGWAMFLYTMRGKNHGYELLKRAKKLMREKPHVWFAQELNVEQTMREDGKRVITPEDIQAEREDGMTEELVQQEFYNSPNAGLVGSYYKIQVQNARRDNRFTRVPWEPKIPVDTFWDLGVSDATSIIFAQRVHKEIRIIDYLEAEGQGLEYFCAQVSKKPYAYDQHHAPHDIKVREFASGGRTRYEIAQGLGIRFTVAPKLPISDGIAAVRAIFPECWFDEDKCDKLIEGLTEYKKEYDSVRRVYNDRPVHDWTSHPADAFRLLALVYRKEKRKNGVEQTHAVSEYDETMGTRGLINSGGFNIPLAHREAVH